jgi:hypothetical protein
MLALGATAAPPSWHGKYFWQGQDGYDGGGTAATGNPVILQVTLILTDHGCTLGEAGFQTDLAIICAAQAIPDGVAITFVSYGNGALVNDYGVAVYKPGERLFSLVDDGAGRVITHWGSLQPDFVHDTTGNYFRRVP